MYPGGAALGYFKTAEFDARPELLVGSGGRGKITPQAGVSLQAKLPGIGRT